MVYEEITEISAREHEQLTLYLKKYGSWGSKIFFFQNIKKLIFGGFHGRRIRI